jgi:regulatory protein YycI of two-component signal transduction system YycFG
MDWSKAKNLFIFLFLAINIFLAAYLFMSFKNDSSNANILNTEKILKSRGYTLNTKIPKITEAYKMHYEIGQYDSAYIAQKLLEKPKLSETEIKSAQSFQNGTKTIIFYPDKSLFTFKDTAPTKNVEISTKEKVEKYSMEFISQLKLPTSNLYLESYKTNFDESVTIRFIEKYNNFYIFNNYIELKITEKGLVFMECNLAKFMGFETAKVTINPAYQLLLKYFVEGENRTIEKIDLGYELEKDVKGSKTPEWRIEMEDGTIECFNHLGQKNKKRET